MSDIETIVSCPLGHKCREIKDGAIHQCAWHVGIEGTNPNTGEKTKEWGCAMTWFPIMMVENSMHQMNTATAVDSFKNEMVEANKASHQVMLAATQLRLIGND